MPIFRFVDPDTPSTIRLNLRNPTGWYLGEGLDVGRRSLVKKFLSQEGVDGAEYVSSWSDIITMTVPLIMTPQASAAAMESLVNALNTELDRPRNGIEYLPHGLTGTSFLIKTFRSDMITLQDGRDGYSPWLRPGEGLQVVLSIDREPNMTQRGVIV